MKITSTSSFIFARGWQIRWLRSGGLSARSKAFARRTFTSSRASGSHCCLPE